MTAPPVEGTGLRNNDDVERNREANNGAMMNCSREFAANYTATFVPSIVTKYALRKRIDSRCRGGSVGDKMAR